MKIRSKTISNATMKKTCGSGKGKGFAEQYSELRN